MQGVGTFIWTDGAPTHNPGLSGAKFAVDKNTYRWYEWVSGTSWVESGDRIQRISGCSAPNYTPTIHNAYFVVNGCTNPEFYYWNGTAWKLLMGVTFPLLAPTETVPQYSFEESVNSGMSYFSDRGVNTLSILGSDEEGLGTLINIKSGSGTDGGSFSMQAGSSSGEGGIGGAFVMSGGEATGTAGLGGSFSMSGGLGTNGGDLTILGGFGSSVGGNVVIKSGSTSDELVNTGTFTLSTGENGLLNPIITNSAGVQYKGFTTTQRNALTGLTAGRVLWNSTLLKLQVYNGTTWENLH